MSEPTRQPAPASSSAVKPAPAANNHETPPPHPLTDVHQALGNLGALRRLAQPGIQTKLEVGAPEDEHEREADRVAAAVMRKPDADGTVDAPGLTGDTRIRRAAEDKKKPGESSTKKAPAPAPPKGAPTPKPAAETKPATEKKPPAAPAKPLPEKPKEKAGPKPPAKPGPETVPETPEVAERKRPDGPVVATKAQPGAVPSVTPAAARTIHGAAGAGRPLAASDRSFYESRFGRDLSGVRIHDSGAAGRAAQDIRARAFTYGQDVFFGPGRYQPGSDAGRELLAHELVHTIQQRPGAKLDRKIQRAAMSDAEAAQRATRDDDAKTLTFDDIAVPAFKYNAPKGGRYRSGPLSRKKGYARSGLRAQRDVWIEDLAPRLTNPVKTHLRNVGAADLAAAPAPGQGAQRRPAPISDAGTYALKNSAAAGSNAPPRYYTGVPADIAAGLTTPEWDRTQAGHGYRGFEVDHVVELQLAGDDLPASNVVSNLSLLDRAKNGASGNFIQQRVADRVNAYVATLPDADKRRLKLDQWRSKWRVDFKKAAPQTTDDEPDPQKDQWSEADVAAGRHLLRDVLVKADDALGSANAVKIFKERAGGIPITIDPANPESAAEWFKPYVPLTQTWHTTQGYDREGPLAEFTFGLSRRATKAMRAAGPARLAIPRLAGAQYAGVMRQADALEMLANLRAKALSPLQIDDVDLREHGFHVDARILTDVPIIGGADIDLTLDGDALTLSKTFTADDISVPEPFHIDNSALTLAASTDGDLSVTGRVDASIDRLGRGYLEGRGSLENGFALRGGFRFTSDLFTQGDVNFAYADHHLSADGTLEIGPGKLTGVKMARLTASYANDRFEAAGHADFDIPGVRAGDVHLSYAADTGLAIAGDLTIGSLPGIRSGSMSVAIAERPGAAGYKVSGHGTAQPDIPGVDAQLTADYDDGAFLARVEVQVQRGMLSGTLEAGATNRRVGPDGRPQPGGAPQPNVTIFGGGSATMQLAPWLRGTAGMRLLPNGEIVVSGELAVPGVNLFEARDFPLPGIDSPEIDVPILGPIVLTLSGGLRVHAGYTAGVLSGSVGIEYNAAHEDRTQVHGALHFHTSAYAGLELYTRVGVGVSVGIASISGNLELAAELRIEPAIDVSVTLDWSPGQGVRIDAPVDVTLSPKFLFTLRGVLSARAAVFHKDWTRDLAQREFGSALQLGLHTGLHYDDRGVTVDPINLEKPDIHPLDLAKQFLQENLR